jgi:putative FmdB family regulatory protein
MTTYEYLCLACEHPFEERRPMTAGPVDIALACPSCGSERVRRRLSFSAAIGGASTGDSASAKPAAGGCCGGGCACGA